MKIKSYRQENIAKIEQAKNYMSDPRHVVYVTAVNQDASDDMMGKHLIVVLSSLFDVENEDLL